MLKKFNSEKTTGDGLVGTFCVRYICSLGKLLRRQSDLRWLFSFPKKVRRHVAKMSKPKNFLLLLTLLFSLPSLAITRVGKIEPLFLPSYQRLLSKLPPLAELRQTRRRAEFLSKPSSELTRLDATVAADGVLLDQQAPFAEYARFPRRAEFLSQASPQLIRQGSQLSVNGRVFPVAWKQWQVGGLVRTSISDIGLMQVLGIELLSTKDLSQQPVEWFSSQGSKPLILASHLSGSYRYLDVTDFARIAGWQLQVDSVTAASPLASGDTLVISSVPAQLKNIRLGHQPWGSRLVIDLDRPTFWQVSDRRTEAVITLEAIADPSLVKQFSAPPPEQIQEVEDAVPVSVGAPDDDPIIRVEPANQKTTIRVDIPKGKRVRVFSLPNPNRLVVDLRSDALVSKDITWAPGIRWRQQFVELGNDRFPAVWLEIEPQADRVKFRPLGSNSTTQVGTAPLITTAKRWQALAAINAGFFNRNNQLPLGAIRRDGKWLSGPILNRGAIAWNDRGQFQFGRLSLQETLITSSRKRLPVLFLNSGYVQAGISRYTSSWGASYTPLTDDEVIVFVQNEQVTHQMPGGTAGQASFPIPVNGYLLTLREQGTTLADTLSVGTPVRLESSTVPSDFDDFPHALGAGPLLLQNRQIVLDAEAEKFSQAFIQQSASRSAIGVTATGSLIIAAFHNRSGGLGPSLTETAQLMQKLGAIDALNLDGGSSTGLYLGGQLLDRSPDTAAPVHNGLGIFLAPLP